MPSISPTSRSNARNISSPEVVEMSVSTSSDLVKFFLYTEIAWGSISTDPFRLNPARLAPKLNPPTPLNKSIIFNLLLLVSTLS